MCRLVISGGRGRASSRSLLCLTFHSCSLTHLSALRPPLFQSLSSSSFFPHPSLRRPSFFFNLPLLHSPPSIIRHLELLTCPSLAIYSWIHFLTPCPLRGFFDFFFVKWLFFVWVFIATRGDIFFWPLVAFVIIVIYASSCFLGYLLFLAFLFLCVYFSKVLIGKIWCCPCWWIFFILLIFVHFQFYFRVLTVCFVWIF